MGLVMMNERTQNGLTCLSTDGFNENFLLKYSINIEKCTAQMFCSLNFHRVSMPV